MRIIGVAVALGLLLACSRSSFPETTASSSSKTTSADLASEELDILETVCRHQFGRGTRDAWPERFLLSFAGEKGAWKDPPTEFLERFRGNVPPVEPVSVAGPDVEIGVHGGGGPAGIILKLTEIRRLDPDTAEVDGDYFSPHRATGDRYRVERRAGAWVVVKDDVRAVY